LERRVTEFPAHPAWDFAVRVYSEPRVAPACLELQNRHGVDVTMMLFCLWLGAERGERLGERLPVLMEAARAWRNAVVLPIRSARRWLKSEANTVETAGLYQTVLAAEIDCEHDELLTLARLAEADSDAAALGASPAAAAENLAVFLGASGARLDAADRSALATILGAAGAAGEIDRVPPQGPTQRR
jgi:uncharacterized protein (TIGR02444 family)